MKPPTWTPEKSQQLVLGLHLNEVEDDAADRSIAPDQALQISNAARDALDVDEAHAGYAWFDAYINLREQGWPWRTAAYIAWAATPRTERQPATVAELAQNVLGLRSPRVISQWRRKNPGIDEAVALLNVPELMKHRGEVLRALVTVAASEDYKGHADRKLFLEMTGDYTPKQDLNVTTPPDVTADVMAEARKKAKAFVAGLMSGGNGEGDGTNTPATD